MYKRLSCKRIGQALAAAVLAAMLLSCSACALGPGYGGYQSSYGYQQTQVYQSYPVGSPYYVAPIPFIPPEPQRVFGGHYGNDRNIRRDANRGRQSLHDAHFHQPQGGGPGRGGPPDRGGNRGGPQGFQGGNGGRPPQQGGHGHDNNQPRHR